MKERKVRVIVIDDSAFMRKVISDLLMSDDRFSVVATARNGKDGLKKIKTLKPDVVTLDVEMPVMNGLTTLKQIMQKHPVPVVMLSSSTDHGAKKTLQAISMGAVDFIAKTSGPISLDLYKIKDEIIGKVLAASEAKVPRQTKLLKEDQRAFQQYNDTIVAIGTSTGGPRALQHILSELPKDLSAAILIVQHMPAGFTKSLAQRLNELSPLKVKEAQDGEQILPGTVYIAPGDFHMIVEQTHTRNNIQLTKDQAVKGHRPSVDQLFKSIAKLQQVNKIAIVLTGMGKDGAEGIKMIKQYDPTAVTIAESEETTIVNGMPTAAISTKCINKIVPLDHMSDIIKHLVQRPRRS